MMKRMCKSVITTLTLQVESSKFEKTLFSEVYNTGSSDMYSGTEVELWQNSQNGTWASVRRDSPSSGVGELHRPSAPEIKSIKDAIQS